MSGPEIWWIGIYALGYGMENTHRNSEYGIGTNKVSRRMSIDVIQI